MNDEEIRRIRRLVVADPQVPPPPPVDPRQAERFHRALGGARRTGAPVDAVTSREAAPATPSAPPAPSSPSIAKRKESPREEARPAVDGHRPRPPVSAVREIAAREAQEAEADEEAALPDPSVTAPPMPIPNVAWTPLPEGWERELTETVSALCRSSEPNFHSWTIQIPVDAETLPHTELRLTFSPHHLLLRFSTQSTRSLALISTHQSQLRALLVRALPGDRHIEIDIT